MLGRYGSAIALTSMAALVLVGCTPEAPTETTPPATSGPPTPTASQPVDLTAVRASWDNYQAQLSEIGEEPSAATIDPLLEIATPEHAAFLLENFEMAAERRIHTEGARSTTGFELQQADSDSSGVTIAVCEDLSEERLVGDEGEDLTRPDQLEPRSRSVSFSQLEDGSDFLVADVVEYNGAVESDPCR